MGFWVVRLSVSLAASLPRGFLDGEAPMVPCLCPSDAHEVAEAVEVLAGLLILGERVRRAHSVRRDEAGQETHVVAVAGGGPVAAV